MQIRYDHRIKQETLVLSPGEFYASKEKIILTTLLGSCVAACLYDPISKVFGMNHFLLSSSRYSKEQTFHKTDAGRYGINAMELLINSMLKLGAKRKNIHAKAFGGGKILKSEKTQFTCVAEVNIRFIKEFLQFENIPLSSSDLGGGLGRVVHFFASDYSVYVRKLQGDQSQKVDQEEYSFWKASIAEAKKKQDEDVVLFG